MQIATTGPTGASFLWQLSSAITLRSPCRPQAPRFFYMSRQAGLGAEITPDVRESDLCFLVFLKEIGGLLLFITPLLL
jgi:hypothetical protein